MPLSAVSKENCLKYIKGSHRWGKWFIPKKFETNLNYLLNDKELGKYSEMVDLNSNQYEKLSWDLEVTKTYHLQARSVFLKALRHPSKPTLVLCFDVSSAASVPSFHACPFQATVAPTASSVNCYSIILSFYGLLYSLYSY